MISKLKSLFKKDDPENCIECSFDTVEAMKSTEVPSFEFYHYVPFTSLLGRPLIVFDQPNESMIVWFSDDIKCSNFPNKDAFGAFILNPLARFLLKQQVTTALSEQIQKGDVTSFVAAPCIIKHFQTEEMMYAFNIITLK